MKVKIIVSYIRRCRRGHSHDFVPPVTGIHLAALTPEEHEVRVVHEQLGRRRRTHGVKSPTSSRSPSSRGSRGPHVSYWTEEAIRPSTPWSSARPRP